MSFVHGDVALSLGSTMDLTRRDLGGLDSAGRRGQAVSPIEKGFDGLKIKRPKDPVSLENFRHFLVDLRPFVILLNLTNCSLTHPPVFRRQQGILSLISS
jgi:hypothetical protein